MGIWTDESDNNVTQAAPPNIQELRYTYSNSASFSKMES